jgi:hypothetical protein
MVRRKMINIDLGGVVWVLVIGKNIIKVLCDYWGEFVLVSLCTLYGYKAVNKIELLP